MTAKGEKQPAWNIWNKPTTKVVRAAPVVLFDESSRKEYVTGFGKRKMQRKMVAQAAIKMKEKQVRAQERQKRKKEADEYIAAMTGAKDDAEGGDGSFIDTRDDKTDSTDHKESTHTAKVGSKAEYETEDGGKVTATVSSFNDDGDDGNGSASDSEEMPGLIPVSQLHSKNGPLKKPKLKGNTSSVNLSSSLKTKKRKHDQNDRKGFHKKAKH